LQRYPGVRHTIRQLHQKYRLAIISDGQTAYAIPELNAVGLSGYFDPIIISGDFGYRKPDERLFTTALTAMKIAPSEVLYVGNDMYRDIYGAQRVGMKTVFFKSNHETKEKEGVNPNYIIYSFPELLNAVRFFEGQS
jgi:putative hydrolase of the HAD superfamily